MKELYHEVATRIGQGIKNPGSHAQRSAINIIPRILAKLRQTNWRSFFDFKIADRASYSPFKFQMGNMVKIRKEYLRVGDFRIAGEVTGYNRVKGTMDEFRVSWDHDLTSGWFKERELQMIDDDTPEVLH